MILFFVSESYVFFALFWAFFTSLDPVFNTSRGHTGGRSHRIFHPPSFRGACLNFSREKDSAIFFPSSTVKSNFVYCVEATIRQRRLLFAGAMARQPAGRLPKRLMDGKLVGGEDPGKGRPEQNWMDCLKDDFQAFGATDGSTVDNRLTFGVDRAVWTLAAKMDDGAPWHKGVLQGAEKFMASWHKEEEEASRRRATKRDSRDLEPPTHL